MQTPHRDPRTGRFTRAPKRKRRKPSMRRDRAEVRLVAVRTPAGVSMQPGITLPMGVSETGLPISVQLVAPYGDEATLVRLAAQLETARPWTDRRPEIVGD